MSENRLSKFNDWFQLLAALAVVISLALVYQELRQTNQIARAERMADSNAAWVGSLQAKMEYDSLSLMRQAIEEPNKLTDTELGHLDGFFELLWQSHAYYLAVSKLDLGVYDLEGGAFDVSWHLQSRFGRVWLEQNMEWAQPSAPELYSAVRKLLDERPIPTKFQYLIDLRSALQVPVQENGGTQSN